MAKFKQIGIDVQVYKIIETNRLSFSETENDILHRMLLKSPYQAKTTAPIISPPKKINASRARGTWKVILNDHQILAANMGDAYREMLLALASDHPQFLEQFSKQKAQRFFIAKIPTALYAIKSSHLAEKFAKPLVDGWWFDSNLGKSQISQRAKAAATVAGLRYGEDLLIAEDGEII